MPLKLNVIDRKGKQTIIDIEEETTIRDAIDDVLFQDNYGVCGGYRKYFLNIPHGWL